MSASLRMILCALLAAGTAGCDIASGISRVMIVEELPQPDAVMAALHAVPGITSVERNTVEATTSWSPFEGYIHDSAYDQFTYSADAISGVVKTRETEDGSRTVELYWFWLNFTPPRQVSEDTRALMDAVYASLIRHAPELPPASQLEETLFRYPKE